MRSRMGGGRVLGLAVSAALAAVSAALAALGALGDARAEGDGTWQKWPGSANAAVNDDPTDREFIKEWEATPPKGYPTLSPNNLIPIKAAIIRYSQITARGGWRPLPDLQLQQGSTGPAVAILQEHLVATGDLKEQGGGPESFDYYLTKAVRRYQASNGLAPTGIVDKRTIAALNVPAAVRLKQLKTNLQRLEQLSRALPKKYVVVNIPAAQVEAIERDRVVTRHAGVVGKPERATPELKSAIHELNFNAVWHLPPTVIEKDLIPKGQDMAKTGQSVLVKYKIDAYGSDGRKLDPAKINWSAGAAGLTYKQQPGPDNPLGFVKLNFNNSHAVYMHDTPSQSLFGRNFRAASSGCVRVHGIEQLAAWVLADQGWKQEHIKHIKETGERRDVRLKQPVPLYFTYLTAWATPDGVVQFRRDLYQKDGVGVAAGGY
ncbi:MAG TPA: L,D-transpeptidase family protein [Hyphomicrobiaceae bacterium]|nr:L,D-transpeptidase family protein [Hyphomicrobiaceae bacterium]